MNKVLVTGANGFLGSNLTRELFRLGYEVRIMIRYNADIKGVSDIPCEVFFGDISNKNDVEQAVAGCNIVIHAASITDQWGISFEEYEKVNFTGTKNIVEASLAQQVDKFIYVSTANTMGPGSKDKPGNELSGFTLFNANSAYINTKYLAQQYVLEQVEANQLPAVIVNPTFMIGPNDIKPSSGKLVLYGLGKKILFYPPGGKNFVYIHDVCQGIVNAIDNGKMGNCYLLAGHNLSYREFFSSLNSVSKETKIMIRIPAFILKLGGILGTIKERLTGRSSKLNYTSAYLLCLNNYYTGKKSENELMVRYTPVKDALRNALTWFKENNYY